MGRGQGNSAPVTLPGSRHAATVDTIGTFIDRAIRDMNCTYTKTPDGSFPGVDVYEPIIVADISDEMKDAVLGVIHDHENYSDSMGIDFSTGTNEFIIEIAGGWQSEGGPYRERFCFKLAS